MKMIRFLIFLALLSAVGAVQAATTTFGIASGTAGTLITPTNIDVPGLTKMRGAIQYSWVTLAGTDIKWSVANSYFTQLTGNTTFTFSGVSDDSDLLLKVQQDATGGRTVAFPASIVYINSTNHIAVPLANTTPNSYSIYHFFQRSGTIYCEGPSTSPSVFSVNLDSKTATVADLQGQLSDGTTLATTGTSQTFINKLVDVNANTLKMNGYIMLTHPHNADGTGAILQTNDSSQAYFGQVLFSNSAAASANYIEYRFVVPEDIDTGVDLRVERWKFRLGGADTGTHRYTIAMASVPDSTAYVGAVGNTVNLDFAGDASGADGDVETVSAVTLTNWKANLTAGHLWVIRVARDGGNAADASTVNSYSGPLVIRYGVVQ